MKKEKNLQEPQGNKVLVNNRRSALVWWDQLPKIKKIDFITKQWGYDKYWKTNYDKIGDSDKIILYQHYA